MRASCLITETFCSIQKMDNLNLIKGYSFPFFFNRVYNYTVGLSAKDTFTFLC